MLLFCFSSIKCQQVNQAVDNLKWYYSTGSVINNWYLPGKNIMYWNTMPMNGTTIEGNYTTLYARTNYVVSGKDILPSNTLSFNLEYKSGIVVYANGKEIYRQYVKEDSEDGYASNTNKVMVERSIIIPADILESTYETDETSRNYTVTIAVELHKYNDEEARFKPRITFENTKYPITRFNNNNNNGECINIARSVSIISSSQISTQDEIEVAFNSHESDNNNEWTQSTSLFPVDKPFIEFTLDGNPTTVLTHFGYVIGNNKIKPKSIEIYGMNNNGKYELIGKDGKNHMIEYKVYSESDSVIFGLPDNNKVYTSYKIVMEPQLKDSKGNYKDISIKEFLMYNCREVICQRYLDINKAKSGTCLNNVRNPMYNYGNTQTCCSIDGKWHNFYDNTKNEEISNFKYPKSVYNIKEQDTMTILPSYKGIVTKLTATCVKKTTGKECGGDIFSDAEDNQQLINFDPHSGGILIEKHLTKKLPLDTYTITVSVDDTTLTTLTTLTIVVTDGRTTSDCKSEGDWPNAMIDERIQLDCVDGTIGYRYRTCTSDNTWSEIDKSNCKDNFTLVATKEMSFIRKTFSINMNENSFDNLFDFRRMLFISKLRDRMINYNSVEKNIPLHFVNPNNEDIIFEYIKPSINITRELSSTIRIRVTVRLYPYYEVGDNIYFEVYKGFINEIVKDFNKVRVLQDDDDEIIIKPSFPPTNFTYIDDDKSIYASGHSFEFRQNQKFVLNSYIEFPSCNENVNDLSCINDKNQVTYVVKSGKLPFEITLYSNGTISGKLTTIEQNNVTIEATFKETKLEFIFVYSSYGCRADGYWPDSLVGTIVTLSCFDNDDGQMNRTCNKDGEWESEVKSCKDSGVLLKPGNTEVFLKFSLESSKDVFNNEEFRNLYRVEISKLSGININQLLYDSVGDRNIILIVNSTSQKADSDKLAMENALKNDDATQAVKDNNEQYTYVNVAYTGYQQVSGYRKKSSGNDYNSGTIAAIVCACVFGFIGVVVICFLCFQIGKFSKVLGTKPKMAGDK